jgi:6-phosphogluconolactonase
MRFSQNAWLVVALMTISSYAQSGTVDQNKQSTSYWVYVGTAKYTGEPSKNLYLAHFDSQSGELKLLGVAAETVNPGFVSVHPGKPFLYAVNEIGDFAGQKNGAVSSFQIESSTGRLKFLNQVPSFGANPSYVTVNRKGNFALVPSYYGGLMALPIRADGSLGPPASQQRETGVGVNPVRQESPHPHSVVLSPDNRFAIAVDLGLDKLFVYRFDDHTGSLQPNTPAFATAEPGSGPRHLAFAPNGRFAYVVNELRSSVSTYSYAEQSGIFHRLQTVSTFPPEFKGDNTGAEVQVAPSGRFLYASNRGHDSIAVFAIDGATGTLTRVQDVPTEGRTPRNFVLDPSGRFLLVGDQDSDLIVVFRVDPENGYLASTGEKARVSSPVCLAFVPVQ